MKGIILIIVIVAVAVIGFMYFKGQQVAPATQVQPTGAAATGPESSAVSSSASTASSVTAGKQVEFTSDGFSPKSVTIKVGETVTWTNTFSSPMWVASNPHPTHTDYPGFDSLKEVPNGDTFSFTFTKAGTWGYHNHLSPGQGGTVVVQ